MIILILKEHDITHTRGPWWIDEITSAHVTIRGAEDECDNQRLAKVWLTGNDFSAGNARLIAAAPEMYDLLMALKSGVFRLPQNDTRLTEMLDYLFAKIRGES